MTYTTTITLYDYDDGKTTLVTCFVEISPSEEETHCGGSCQVSWIKHGDTHYHTLEAFKEDHVTCAEELELLITEAEEES